MFNELTGLFKTTKVSLISDGVFTVMLVSLSIFFKGSLPTSSICVTRGLSFVPEHINESQNVQFQVTQPGFCCRKIFLNELVTSKLKELEEDASACRCSD